MPDRTDVPPSHAAWFGSWQRLRYQQQWANDGWEPPAPAGPDQVPPPAPDAPGFLQPPGEPPVSDWPDTDPPQLPAYTVSEAMMPGLPAMEPFQLADLPLGPADLAGDWQDGWPDLGERPDAVDLVYLRDLIDALRAWAAAQAPQGRDAGGGQ